MQEEKSYKIKNLRKTGVKKDLVDSNGEIVQPGSRILKGYWGDWIVFGSRIPGFTLKLKIRIIPSGTKIRLINPLMTPDNNWENKRTSVHIVWGDGTYDKIYKKKINSGRFNRDSEVTIEHTYTAEVGDEMWLSITSIEPLVPYGCEIVEMLGQFPYDRYDLNMDRDGHYCGLFGVDQYIETYPELNKLYGAGKTITKVSSELLDNWRDIGNMNRMFEGWGITEVPTNFFKYSNKFHPDPNPEGIYQRHNMIVDTCKSYYRTFANCPNLVTVSPSILANWQSICETTEEMFDNCPKLQNTINLANNDSWKNASKMYRNCIALENVHESFCIETLGGMETIESIFDGCSNLRTINWDKFCAKAVNLINAKAAFRGTAFTEVAFNMREMTQLGSIEYMYADMIHLRKAISSSGPNTANKYQYWRHSHPDTLEYAEKKLRISHLFENSGDRKLGMIIGNNFFFDLISHNRPTYDSAFPNTPIDEQRQMNSSEPLHLDVTYVFAGAYIDKYEPRDYKTTVDDMFYFGSWNQNNNNNGYHLDHFYDGAAFVNNMEYLALNTPLAGYRAWYLDYALANIKSRIGYLKMDWFLGASYIHMIKSVRGIFKGCTIDYRFNPYTIYRALPQGVEYQDIDYCILSACTDYSEMFMNVTYKHNEFPIDHIVGYAYSDANVLVKADNLFAGSNIKSYRPIHPLSNRKPRYSCNNLIENSPAPKYWMMNGFTDTSGWEPKKITNPLIYWVEITNKNKTIGFLDSNYTPKKIDWGDGDTSPTNSHTYKDVGVYKIVVVDDVYGKLNQNFQFSVFKIDGELPFGAVCTISHNEWQSFSRLQEIGPRVGCLASQFDTPASCGYVDPLNFVYGSNKEFSDGVSELSIVDPVTINFEFSSNFVLIDKTVSMSLTIEPHSLYIGDQTYIDVKIEKTRNHSYDHHMFLDRSNMLNFPQSLFTMFEINHDNTSYPEYNYYNWTYSNISYLTRKHFSLINKVKYIPRLSSYFNPSYEMYRSYRLHSSIRYLKSLVKIDAGTIGTWLSSAASDELGLTNIIGDQRDLRRPKITQEYIDFELENIPDEDITLFRLDSLPFGFDAFKNRPLGKVKVQIFLFDESEDEEIPEIVVKTDGVLPNLGRIKSKDKRAIIRVWSDHALWPSCKSSIVGIYGSITNKEGDFIIHQYDFQFKNLAPNIKHISEDLLWGLINQSTLEFLFSECTELEEIPVNLLNNFHGSSLYSMFRGCTKLKVVPDYLIKRCSLSNINLNCGYMFANCTNIEYVFKPFAYDVHYVNVGGMFHKCRTYAFRGYDDIDKTLLKHVSVSPDSYMYYKNNGTYTGIKPMTILADSKIPILDYDNDTIMAWGESNEDVAKVATFIPFKNLNLSIYKNNTKMLFRAQCLRYDNKQIFNENYKVSFNLTPDELSSMMHTMHTIDSIIGHAEMAFITPGAAPHHNTLLSNKKLSTFAYVLSGTKFNYSPNLFFVRQDEMRSGHGLLYNVTFDKIPYLEYVPPTHLPDRLGRPIYIGGGKDATRYRSRILDRMLCYRNNFINIISMFKYSAGDLICPKFENHILSRVSSSFADTTTYVPRDTFINVDSESNMFKNFSKETHEMFYNNTTVDTDCRIFHVWKDVTDSTNATGYEFANTVKFIHPPKDMFSELTNLTTLYYTFYKSNVRSLPDCNPRIKIYDHFAATSKLSAIPANWFKYNGTETLDIRYAFDDCKGLIVTDKLIDPTVTVPVLKYSSLRNAWSIIGDDPEIFAGVNTKLDGTDKSLVKVIPEEDMFKQTIDVHDPRWTLSVKALGMETIGHEPVQDDNLFMVIWGDGSSPSVVSYRDIEWEDYSHKYDAAGRYQVLILSTQWCCFVNSPQELSSKYTTYSIDGMFQNTTCEALAKAKLTSMFGHTVEGLYSTLFDKCSDIATVKDFPDMFFEFKKLKTLPDTILNKMVSLESLHRFIMTTGITSIPVKIFSKNTKLKDLTSAFEALQMPTVPADLFINNPALESLYRTFCDNKIITEYPRNLLRNNPNIKNLTYTFSLNTNFTMDDSYDDFFAVCTKVIEAEWTFGRCKIKSLPPNLLNRMTSLNSTNGMFANCTYARNEDFDKNFTNEEFEGYKAYSDSDSEFTIPSGFLPKSVVGTSAMFFFRIKLKSYPADIFTGNTVLNSARWMFMNTGITRVHSNTFHTMSGETLDIRKWLYKDKRLGKKFYSHYIPRFINPAINVKTVYTDSSLLGAFGTMTETELFAGINTNPTNIHSLYVQEFEPATFKLKMNGDGTFITMKPITGSAVTFTDLTYIQWGDGTENLYEENIDSSQIQNVIKHIYKTPGTYTIIVGAKYCLVPIVDTMPEAYQVESVVFPEDINQVKSVSIGGEYGVGHLEINRDKMYTERESAEVEMSLVPRPYYVGETYTVDVTVDLEGLDVGETTVMEVNVVRDTSDPFERLEIGGVLGFMQGITTFPKISTMPELQYQKWIGKENFFDYNKHITSLDSSFMNIPFEIRFADKVFWALTNLTRISCIFWNSKVVIEPGWAPDFNKSPDIYASYSAFRGGREGDEQNEGFNVSAPYNKIIWRVGKEYQPIEQLSKISDTGNLCRDSDITHVMKFNMTNLQSFRRAYKDCTKLTWVPADYFRTLNSNQNELWLYDIFINTTSLTTITPSTDGKTLLDFLPKSRIINLSSMFAGSGLSFSEMINILNNSPLLKTPVQNAMYRFTGMFSWRKVQSNCDASDLNLHIGSNGSSLIDLSNIFSYDGDINETQYDKSITLLYSVKAGSVSVSDSNKVKVTNMFDHCYASADVSDAHKVFVVEGDDANFTKAKKLADDSALNTLTVMTTTVVPK